MKFDVFLKSWQGTQLENRWQRFLIAVLVLSNLLLAVAAFSRNTVVAIQPPTLSETAEVSRNQATQPYLESWGLYLAELMGNVTPGNVSFIGLLSSRYFHLRCTSKWSMHWRFRQDKSAKTESRSNSNPDKWSMSMKPAMSL